MSSISDDPSFDRRLTVLETRFDTVLPTLATRSDIDALRAEILKALHDKLKWTIGIVLTMLIAFVGINFTMMHATRGMPLSAQTSAASAQPGTAGKTGESQAPHINKQR